MKENIHPKYVECTVSCACGYTFKTRSTRPEIKLDICGNCHPFFTGKQKLVDTAGRVEKFKKKFGETVKVSSKKEKPVKKVKARAEKLRKTTEKILTSAAKKKRPTAK